MVLARYLTALGAALLLIAAATASLIAPALPMAQERTGTAPSSVSASELQAAIDAIKRRVAEQQEAREDSGQSALAGELRSAREAIAELTQSLTRLRTEREALSDELAMARDAEARGAAELAALHDAQAGLRAALAEAEDAATTAQDELAALQERTAAEAVEREGQLAEMRQLLEADGAERRRLEEALAAALAERDAVAGELGAAREGIKAAETALAEGEAREAAAATKIAALESELEELRLVARHSVDEVEALGETLLAALAENAELTTALAEAGETRSLIEAELRAMRLELDRQPAAVEVTDEDGTLPTALVASDAVVEELDAELTAAKREIDLLTEELIARDKQLADGAAVGDADALAQRIGLLQREVDTLNAANLALADELADLRRRAELAAPEVVTASLDPDAALDRFLSQLNAVDTGDGWWLTVPEGLVFAPGSDQLAAGTEPTVAQIAALLGYFGDAPVRIVGHTDSFGDAEINRSLSLQRAETVGRALVEEYGIAPSRVSTEGFGEEQPIASNATIEGRRANRRVEIYIQR